MVKKKYVIASFFGLLLVTVVIAFHFSFVKPSSESIFANSQTSVVELKAKSNNDIISYGTAVYIGEGGTFVSNAHMVTYKQSGVHKEFENFYIRFSFEKDYREISMIKYDLKLDISILKLDNFENNPGNRIQIDDTSKVYSGSKVYAIGNGMNHGISISQGLISLPRINIEYDGIIHEMIQCDLTINEGNGGGALLNHKEKLIGITTFRLKDYTGNIIYGIAYCIPINTVMTYHRRCSGRRHNLLHIPWSQNL